MTATEAGAARSFAQESKRFGLNALVYLISNVLVRGVSLLLTPLYTRAMDPSDFAVVAVTNAIGAVLTITLGMALYGCIPRLFFEFKQTERRAFFGTLLALSLTVPVVLVAILFALGSRGYLDVFETVRFNPHLKLVLWTSLFSIYSSLPVAVYMSHELPRKAAAINMLSGFTQLGFALLFVARLHGGALGVLRANLASSAIVGAASIVLMLRMSTISLALPGMRQALVFSLPLVPHLVANWALSISDRIVLDRYVPPADIGRYSLGYTFGLIVSVVAASLGNALSPMANRQLRSPATEANVPPLGTYMLAATSAFALVVAMTSGEVIGIIAPKSYAGASAVAPWAVLGAVLQGVYLVWSIGTWFSMKTKLVPFITAISAALNIGVNLVYVPRYGIMAAAVSTVICYAASAAMGGMLAQRLHPIPWEYRRWALMAAVAFACYALGMALPTWGVWESLAAKLTVSVVGFPMGLLALRFFTSSEIERGRAILSRAVGRA